MPKLAPLRVLRILAAIAAWAVALGVASCLAIARLGRVHWTFDLLSHFHVQYLWLGFGALVVALLARAWWGAALSLAVILWAGYAVAPLLHGGGAAPSSDAPRVRIAALNVLTSNDEHRLVSDWLLEQRADVLVVQEVDDVWAEVLDQSLVGYRRLTTDTIRDDNFGMAIYLAEDWDAEDPVVHLTDLELPWVEVLVRRGATGLRVFAVHTIPPVGGKRFRSRNKQVADAAAAAEQSGEPAIIAGDLNATIWSTALRNGLRGDLRGDLQNGAMRPACLGFGLWGSWHSRLLWTGGILIDHVLVDDRLAVLSHAVGEHVGSDHRGVVVDLAVR